MINADIGPGHGYQLTTSLSNASEAIPLAGSELTFWGVPADPSHDADRGGFGGPLPADSPRKPFLTYPANCSASSLTAGVDVNSWETPNTHVTATADLPAPTGCDALSIDPVAERRPQHVAGRHAVRLRGDDDAAAEQRPGRAGHAGAAHRPGDAARGRLARTAGGRRPGPVHRRAVRGRRSDDPAACPDAAKIGKVSIHSPLQPNPLTGSLYFGAPTAGSPFRIFLVASGPGTLIKLIGNVSPDPSTRPADDRVRQPAAAAVRQPDADVLRRVAGGAREPAELRHVHGGIHGHRVERPDGQPVVVVRHHGLRVAGAVRTELRGRHDGQPGRRHGRAHDPVRARRRRAEPVVGERRPPARAARAPRDGAGVLRRRRERRHLPGREPGGHARASPPARATCPCGWAGRPT